MASLGTRMAGGRLGIFAISAPWGRGPVAPRPPAKEMSDGRVADDRYGTEWRSG